MYWPHWSSEQGPYHSPTALRCGRTWLHLGSLHVSTGQRGLRSISQPCWLEEITRRVQMLACPICCCLVFLTSACCPVCVLDLNRQLFIIKQVVGDLPEHGLTNGSLSAIAAWEGQPRLPSMHSKNWLSFNCFYQIVCLPAWVNETLKDVKV